MYTRYVFSCALNDHWSYAPFLFDRQVRGMEGRKRAGLMLMEFWMEEEENRRKAEEFKIRR